MSLELILKQNRIVKSVLINGAPVSVLEGGVHIERLEDNGPYTATLTLLVDHLVIRQEETEAGSDDLDG